MNVAPASVPPDLPQTTGVDANNPWPGLEAFAESDCEFFFGRDEETAELLRLVKRETLTVLFGQSGLGKTSLLRAGLFPKLRRADCLPIYIRLDHPESAPPLAQQVRSAVMAAVASEGAEAPDWTERETLWEYFHRKDVEFWSAKNRLLTPVLVFDQFEELFTLGRENAARRARGAAFIGELADLVEQRPPAALKEQWEHGGANAGRFLFERADFKVLLSLREDYLPDLEGLRPLIRSIMHNRFRIRRMNGKQALEVVAGPGRAIVDRNVAWDIVQLVAASHVPVLEAGLTDEQMLEIMVDPAMLSLVCRQLNNRRIAEKQAKITGDLIAGSHREILETFYRESLAGLPAAAQIFVEDHLLTRSGYRNNVALDDALAEEGITQPVIDKLITRRLLRCEERLGVLRIELTHDVLTGVIRASRDTRRQQAAEAELAAEREAAEKARVEVERQLTLERARLARERRKTMWASLTSVLAIVSAIVGWLFYEVADDAIEEAELAKTRAEKAWEQADGLINFMGDDLRDKLRPLGQLQVLQAVNERVLEYYRSVTNERGATEALWRKGMALQTSGEIHSDLGETTKSLEAHTQALEVARELHRREPDKHWSRYFLGLELGYLGDLVRIRGDLALAIEFLEKSLPFAESVAAQNQEYWGNLAYARERLSIARRMQGQAEEAARLMRLNADEYQAAAEKTTATDYMQFVQFDIFIDLGDEAFQRGNVTEAFQHFDRASDLATKMLEAKPSDLNRQYNVSRSCDRLGAVYQALGKLNEAFEAVKRSYEIFARLKEHDPRNTLWMRSYSVTTSRYLEIGEIKGGSSDSRQMFEHVLQVRRDLAKIDESSADAQHDLSETLIAMGDYLRSHGNLTRAGDCYQEALRIRSRFALADSTNLHRQEAFAQAHGRLGDWAAARGENKAAMESYAASRVIRQKLVEQDPLYYHRKSNLAAVDEATSDVLRESSDLPAARQAAEQALALRKELAGKDPANVQWQAELGKSHRKIAEVCFAQNLEAEGFEQMRSSRDILQRLYEGSKDNVFLQEELSATARVVAELLLPRGSDPRILELLKVTAQFGAVLIKSDPENSTRQMDYARALWLTGNAIMRLKPDSKPEALKKFEQARAVVSSLKGKVEFTREQEGWAEAIEERSKLR